MPMHMEAARSLSVSPQQTDSAQTSPEPEETRLLKLSLAQTLEKLAQMPVYPHKREERKRRRVIGNMDNTLDGLVAKRADVDPFAKRYQTETEAIELPDDEAEMKRLETDPDVSTRMCSICGYQGKWVSEMIRHKRVHTNERPFKCKYCNRTSKWKADLIRHVAKTHGIRVVSKYSRSKAFDVHHDGKDDGTPAPKGESKPVDAPCAVDVPGVSTSVPTNVFRCLACYFEQDSVENLVSHLRSAHNLAPFDCAQCKRSFEDVATASNHCSPTLGSCSPLSIKFNFSCTQKPHHGGAISTATTSSPCSTRSSDSERTSSAASLRTEDDDVLPTLPGGRLACAECPFRTDGDDKLLLHKAGHETPKGLMNYKCVFCSWYSKKKTAVERHMLVHTPRPEAFMPSVERNLITPAMLLDSAVQQSAAAAATAAALGLVSPGFSPGGLSLFGGGSLQQQPHQALDLLSALSSLYQPLAAPPSVPDLGAFQTLSANPLLAFGLCSLLDARKQQSTAAFEHVA